MRLVLISVLTLSVAACSLFDVKKAPGRGGIEEREVPIEARQEGKGLRRKVVVLPFLDSQVKRSTEVKSVARRTVVGSLIRTGHFVVINNSDFPQDLKSFLNEDGEYNLGAIARMSANMGISGIVEGKVLDIKAKRLGDDIGVFRKIKAQVTVTVQIRMYGTQSNKEVLNTVRKATVESETTRVAETSYSDRFLQEDPGLVRAGVQKAFGGAIPAIVRSMEKLSWEGRIAMVSGDRIFVNAGRLSGIQVGDVLKVVEDGKEVFDPDTGSFIGIAPGRMKGTVEVVSYFGKDGSIGVVHSGSGFKENDKLELY